MSTGKPPSQDVEHYGQSRVVLLLSIGIFALFVLWAYFAELDRITRGVGQVISSSRSQVVQSYDGGVLERLLIKPGQMVKKGQLLAVLDPTRSEANYEETRAKVMSLKAQIARLNAEMLDKPLVFSKEVKGMPLMVTAQTELYQKRRKALREDIESLNRSLDLAQQELKMNEPLLAAGDTSLADVLRLRRQVAELQAQITTRRNKYFQDTQAELTQAESELASITQTMKARRDALDRTELRAPMAGLVKSIRITTVGATLKPGEEILELVPAEDDLIVEVRIRPPGRGLPAAWPAGHGQDRRLRLHDLWHLERNPGLPEPGHSERGTQAQRATVLPGPGQDRDPAIQRPAERGHRVAARHDGHRRNQDWIQHRAQVPD